LISETASQEYAGIHQLRIACTTSTTPYTFNVKHNTHTMFSLRSALPRAGARAFSTTTPRSLAKMQLIGRLADTPAVNPTSTGRDVIKYAVGVSTGSKDENGNRGVSWFRVASFSEGPQKDLLLSLPKG
jgi:hypothetical protein